MKKNEILVSFIIPVYNCEAFIDLLIEDIIKISKFNYEVIFVNDGSRDNSLEIINKVKKKYSFRTSIIIINQENQGVSVARNKGLQISRGTYVFFVDADDRIRTVELENAIGDFESANCDVCVFGLIDCFITKKGKRYKYNYVENNMYLAKEFAAEFGRILNELVLYSPCNKIYRRELLSSQHILFNEKYALGEDILFNLDVFNKMTKIQFSENYVYEYNHFDTRKNTGSTKYYSNELAIYIEIYKRMEAYINFFDVSAENQDEFNKFVIRRNSSLLQGAFSASSPLTVSEKYNYIKKLFKCDIIAKALQNNISELSRTQDKMLLKLYQNKLYLIIFFIFFFKNKTRL